MKTSETWRLSRIPYRESVYRSLAQEKGRMWWGAFGQGRQAKNSLFDDFELAERALRIAKYDKSIVAIFNIIVALSPFAAVYLGVEA